MIYRILFVDDEQRFVMPHVEVLEEAGYEVVKARSHREAMDQLQRDNFDLIILDLILPVGEHNTHYEHTEPDSEIGLGLHKIIRRDLQLTQVPIIFLTVVGEQSVRKDIQDLEKRIPGSKWRILLKPALPSRLLALVHELLGG